MKSAQQQLMLIIKNVNLVMMFVPNVMEEKQTIVMFVNINIFTETHVLTHVMMENGQTHPP
jgi:hypothetical protein